MSTENSMNQSSTEQKREVNASQQVGKRKRKRNRNRRKHHSAKKNADPVQSQSPFITSLPAHLMPDWVPNDVRNMVELAESIMSKDPTIQKVIAKKDIIEIARYESQDIELAVLRARNRILECQQEALQKDVDYYKEQYKTTSDQLEKALDILYSNRTKRD